MLTSPILMQGKTLEQVDYLFVQKGFAGLRRNFDVTEDDVLQAFENGPSKGVEKAQEIETAY